MTTSDDRETRPALRAAGVALLLLALSVQQLAFVRRQSQTWDEADHLYAGYRSLLTADHGLNPEHPPLVKMLAAVPLLGLPLRVPALQQREFKHEAFLGGREFLYGNDADALLFRARAAASLLSLLLSLLVFLCAREMFGTRAGFVALALVVFDPNLLAHGALVTTDTGLSCFMFGAVYAFYRYVRAPSSTRLVLVGLLAGLGLASKHTGLLILPILGLLAVAEVVSGKDHEPRLQRVRRLAVALAAVTLLAVGVLWACYGFRYAARPGGLPLLPPLAAVLRGLPPTSAGVIGAMARAHLLPESYLYGLADVLVMNQYYTSYVLGRVYPHGVWFYFPVAFAVKSTLPFLVLPLVVVAAVATRTLRARREVLFLAVPPAFHLAVAMSSRMNIGVRHILPVYAFLAVLGAGALLALSARARAWRYATAALVALQVASALRAFPAFIAYSNELWGGPNRTYRYLTDSNSDWAQQLKTVQRYLRARDVRQCWFAYFGQGTADLRYYDIPCRPLPVLGGFWLGDWEEVPATIEGPVLVSAGVLSGFEFGPGPLNPYGQFQVLRPTAQLDGGVFVYDGHFEVPLASALTLVQRAGDLLGERRTEEALAKARAAAALAPDDVRVLTTLGDALQAAGRKDESRPVYERALGQARSVEPEFQADSARSLQAKLAGF